MTRFDPDRAESDIEARTVLQPLVAGLQAAGISSAVSDARCLLGLVLGRDDPVLPHETIAHWNAEHQSQLEALRHRRVAGEPISRMRGWREFWSMRFAVSPATLDPRPDSECVIEAATRWARHHRPAGRCLDLGTGSGCLLLAFLSELPDFTGIGIDISQAATKIAMANAKSHGLDKRAIFHQQDFAKDLTSFGKFDLIISNPPYIPSAEIAGLDVDVRHFDPMAALDGGHDGLVCWRLLLPQCESLLADNGSIFVEIGAGQQEPVCQLATASGFRLVKSHRDLAGHERCLHFQKEL